MVPHPTTALTGSLLELERSFSDHRGDIEQTAPAVPDGAVA